MWTCENCGQDMADGQMVGAWEDGDNSQPYVICPHCRHKNVMWGWEGDDD